MGKQKELEKYKKALAAAVAEKERLAEELKQVRFEYFKLENENLRLKSENSQVQAEIKAACKEATKATSEQMRLLNIVKGLCTLTPNSLSIKQLVVQNKALKLKLADADFRVRQMYLNYESLEQRHNDLLLSRREEIATKLLRIQLLKLEEKYNNLKVVYYRLKNDVAV